MRMLHKALASRLHTYLMLVQMISSGPHSWLEFSLVAESVHGNSFIFRYHRRKPMPLSFLLRSSECLSALIFFFFFRGLFRLTVSRLHTVPVFFEHLSFSILPMVNFTMDKITLVPDKIFVCCKKWANFGKFSENPAPCIQHSISVWTRLYQPSNFYTIPFFCCCSFLPQIRLSFKSGRWWISNARRFYPRPLCWTEQMHFDQWCGFWHELCDALALMYCI